MPVHIFCIERPDVNELPTILFRCKNVEITKFGNDMNHAFPHPRIESLLQSLYSCLLFKRRMRRVGRDSFISPFAKIDSMECVSIGNRAVISRGTLVNPVMRYMSDTFSPSIFIGDDVYVGRGCTLSTAGEIIVGDEVTIGDNVYIGGGRHGYEDITKGVRSQPVVCGSVRIARRAWIGYGSFIASTGELEIGEHSIVGANSVVNRSVPAFTIVAGAPARPVKYYDHVKSAWVRI